MHAHEGCLLHINGTFMWYGTSRKHLQAGDWLSSAVQLYTSPDLAAWSLVGTVFEADSMAAHLGPRPPYR